MAALPLSKPPVGSYHIKDAWIVATRNPGDEQD